MTERAGTEGRAVMEERAGTEGGTVLEERAGTEGGTVLEESAGTAGGAVMGESAGTPGGVVMEETAGMEASGREGAETGIAVRGKRDEGLDAARGLAILLVMLGHCIVLNNMQDGIVYDAIAAVQMPLFMAVSGLVAGKTLCIGSGRELGRRLLRRAGNYLVPFFVWIFVLYPDQFLERTRKVLFQLDLGLWFLMTLFLLTAALYAAVWARDCTAFGWGGFWLVIGTFAAAAAAWYVAGGRFLSPHLTVNYLPFFLGGYLAGDWRHRQPMRQAAGAGHGCGLLWAGLGAAAGYVWLIVRFDMVYAHNRAEWILQLLAGACGTAAVLICIGLLKGGRLKRLLSFIGRYTLEIYVLHFHFARILGLDEEGLSLYSIKGMCAVAGTFLLMSAITAFLIFTLKKLRVTDFLLFGRLS